MDGVDHGANAEEQTGLEQGMTNEVKDAGCVTVEQEPRGETRGAEPEHHVANLADSRVGENLLELLCHQSLRRREERCENTDPSGHMKEPCSLVNPHNPTPVVEQRHEPGDEVDTALDHRRSVDKGGNGAWTGHCLREPLVKRKLRRLTERSC